MNRACFPALLALLLGSLSPAAAQSLTSDIREPELSQAWDLVFVAEGYAAGEEAQFLADAQALGRKLRRGSSALPLREAYTFNLHYLFVASRERVSWKPGGRQSSTALRSQVDREGILVCEDARADALAVRYAPDVDSVVILARLADEDALDPESFGLLASVVGHPDDVRANADMPYDGRRVRLPSSDPDAFIHELGHALFGLGDEYAEYEGAIPADEAWQIAETPNLSLDPSGARWAHVVDTVFEGGGYYEEGVFRGEEECRMGATRSQPFCRVCQAAIAGVPQASVPAPPRLTRPAAGAVLRPGATVSAGWTAREDPIYFLVEVYRQGTSPLRKAVWEGYVEGHLRSVKIDLPRGAGQALELRVSAVNVAGESSDGSIREFERLRPAAAGLRGALEASGTTR